MILLCLLKLFCKFHSHLEGMVNTPKKFMGLKILESFTFQRVTKFIVVLLLTAEFQHRWAPGAENITGHLAYSGKTRCQQKHRCSDIISIDKGISDMVHRCLVLVLRIKLHMHIITLV